MANAKSKKPTGKKKPVSAKQATAVADMLKSQGKDSNGSGSNNSGPALPTPASNPAATDNDSDEQE